MTEKKRTAPRKSTTKKKVRPPKESTPINEDTPLTASEVQPLFSFPDPPSPEERAENNRATCLQWALTHFHNQANVPVEQILATADAFTKYVKDGTLPAARTEKRKTTAKVTPLKKKGK